MVIQQHQNIAIPGNHGRAIVTDFFFAENHKRKPVLIFCHGYKGFKDWGGWNLMAKEFARQGFFFVKFNFAFNGGTLENPLNFPDPEAFGENTYTKELDDIGAVLDFLEHADFEFSDHVDLKNIALMGHSRGGGVVVIKAAEDTRIKKIITLAAVSDFGERFPKGAELASWKEKGIAYIENTRTKQHLPHLYEFYQDFKANEQRFTISRAAKALSIPALIVHGKADSTVPIAEAFELQEWIKESELLTLEESDHVFGMAHPWDLENVTKDFEKVILRTVDFLNQE